MRGGGLGNTPPGSFEQTKLNAPTKLQQKENTGIKNLLGNKQSQKLFLRYKNLK